MCRSNWHRWAKPFLSRSMQFGPWTCEFLSRVRLLVVKPPSKQLLVIKETEKGLTEHKIFPAIIFAHRRVMDGSVASDNTGPNNGTSYASEGKSC